MSDLKTPRTLIGEFLDASRTQTTRIGRQRERVIRTPDTPSKGTKKSSAPSPGLERSPTALSKSADRLPRSPSSNVKPLSGHTWSPGSLSNHSRTEKGPKHNRVSSLRGKKRSYSDSRSLDEEPTPRQLIEGFLEGNDSTAPILRYKRRTSQTGVSSSQPVLPVAGRRSSIMTVGNRSMTVDSDTPRTLIQRFLQNATDVVETPVAPKHQVSSQLSTPEISTVQQQYQTPSPFKQSTTESTRTVNSSSSRSSKANRSSRGKFNISVPRSEADSSVDGDDDSIQDNYREPSLFQSSLELDIFESQPVERQSPNRHERNRGTFNISVPAHIMEEMRQRDESQSMEDSASDVSDSIPTYNTAVMGTDYHYELPLKPADGESSIDDDNEVDNYGDQRSIPGNTSERSIHDSLETVCKSQGHESLDRNRGSYSQDFVVNKTSESTDMNRSKSRDIVESSFVSVNDTSVAGLRSLNDLESMVVMETSPISEGHVDETDSRQFINNQRHGRWSEGHKSRFESPSGLRSKGRFSEGHQGGEGHLESLISPRQQLSLEMDHQSESKQVNRSSESLMRSSRSDRSRSEMSSPLQRSSRGHDLESGDEEEYTAHQSHNKLTDEFYAVKLATGKSDNVHILPNTTVMFSPRISSTQKSTLDEDLDDSPLQTVTPSPVVSPDKRSRRSGSRTPRDSNSPRKHSHRFGSSTPRDSNSTSKSRLYTESFTLQDSGTDLTPSTRHSTQNMSGRNSKSSTKGMVTVVGNTSLQSSMYTPDSVGRSGGTSHQRSSSSKTYTPESVDRSGQNSHRRSSSSKANTPKSVSKSDGNSQQSVLAGRRIGQNKGMTSILPNSSINFSPPIASTQNMATISRLTPGTRSDPGVGQGDDQWEDVDQMDEEAQASAPVLSSIENVPIKVKTKRKPRKPNTYSIPVNTVRKHFNHFADLRVSKDAIEEVMKVSEKYWDTLAADLESYAHHGGRKTINMADFVLLFKRQGHITERQSMNSLIEKHLPMEYREKLIPVARAGNRIEPKL